MNFSDRVMSITDPPAPKGTAQYITPKQYIALDDKAQRYYRPEWQRYITKRRREYEDCDLGHRHFMGWQEYEVGVGKPYRYCWHRPLFPEVIDSVMKSNVLMTRIMGSKVKEA